MLGDNEALDENMSMSGKNMEEACDGVLLRVVCEVIERRDCRYVAFVPGDFKEYSVFRG